MPLPPSLPGFSRTASLLVFSSAAVLGCGDGGGVTPPPPVASVTVDAGDSEILEGGATRVTATLRSAEGDVLSGRTVVWETSDPAVATLTPEGPEAELKAVGGGTAIVTATSEGARGSTQVTVTPLEATRLTVLSGENGVARAGSPLPEPVRIRVLDQRGDPLDGVSVGWEVTAGGGTLASPGSETDTGGEATATWTLGPEAAVNRLRITAGPLSPVTVESLGWSVSTGSVTLAVPGDSVEVAARLGDRVADGVTLTLEAESRWIGHLPVVIPDALGRGVVRAGAPGRATVGVRAFGIDMGTVTARMTPPSPAVFDATQNDWPRDATVTLHGYRMNEVGQDAVTVGGVSATWLGADSATMRVDPGTLETEECVRSADVPLEVADVPVHGGETVVHQPAPADPLAVGEARTSGPSFCLRTPPGEPARYAVAKLDRALIEASKVEREPFGGAAVHAFSLADRSVGAESPARAPSPRTRPATAGPGPTDALIGTAMPTGAPDRASPIFDRSTPWRVGDSFTQDFSPLTSPVEWRVAAVYPPNLVVAIPDAAFDQIWRDPIVERVERSFAPVADGRLQAVYEGTFGSSALPESSAGSGQLVVLVSFLASGVAGSAGCRVMFLDLDLTGLRPDGTILEWGPDRTFLPVLGHELAHSWHCSRNGFFSGARWVVEGLADFISEEVARVRAGIGIDENRPWQGAVDWTQTPIGGDFRNGYAESAHFLRHLAWTLAWSGLPWEEARRVASKGAEEGWYGRQPVDGAGLTARMRERVRSDWDPVEARLDWVLSIAVDDRGTDLAPIYDAPDVLESWRPVEVVFDLVGPGFHFGSLRAGEGRVLDLVGNPGSNGYALVEDPNGLGIVLEGNADTDTVVWKILRFR